jgi:hypothetical protein
VARPNSSSSSPCVDRQLQRIMGAAVAGHTQQGGAAVIHE